MAESYCNRYKSGELKYLRVIWKEKKMVNRFHRWCIVLYHGNSEGTELYSVERWVNFITEFPCTAYFPIDKPLIKMPIIQRFHCKGKNRLALNRKKPFTKVSMKYEHKVMKLMTETSPFLITHQTHRLNKALQHTSQVWLNHCGEQGRQLS